jgi:hypothetical protein
MTIDTMITPAEDIAAWQEIAKLMDRAAAQLQAGREIYWTL